MTTTRESPTPGTSAPGTRIPSARSTRSPQPTLRTSRTAGKRTHAAIRSITIALRAQADDHRRDPGGPGRTVRSQTELVRVSLAVVVALREHLVHVIAGLGVSDLVGL